MVKAVGELCEGLRGGWLRSLLPIPFFYCGYGLSIINIPPPIRVPLGTVPPVRPLETTCTGVQVFVGNINGGRFTIYSDTSANE